MFNLPPRRYAAVVASLFVFATAGCKGTPPSQGNAPLSPNAPTPTPGTDAALLAVNDLPTADAPKPNAKPFGVVIAFPLSGDGADKNARDFASGIGYYLTDAVAGAPEFGQSPLRTTVYQVARERRIASLQMTPVEAARVARVCGATHFGTGTYTESANLVKLTYELRPVEAGTNATGTFAVAAPNREALIAQLPRMAQQLRAALSAANSNVTVAPLTGMTPETMAKIGACADATQYTLEQIAFLLETGKRVPLAAELAIFTGTVRSSPAQAAPYSRLLLQAQPRNTQTLACLGYAIPQTMTASAPTFFALADRHPDNYLLAHTAAWVARTGSDWDREATYSARGATNAPANPDARLAAGWSLSRQADAVRQGRQSGDMDAAMLAKTTPLYMNWLAQVKAATQCDPLYGKAYQRLSNAATFAGDSNEADAAMTMARKLNTNSPYDTYQWALEMYQPKWGGDPSQLQAVAREAASARYVSPVETVAIYKQLGRGGFKAEQKQMGDRIFKETTAAIAKNPDDNYAHYLRGWVLTERGDRAGATADFAANVRIFPKDASVRFELGRNYTDIGQFKKAEEAFRKADSLRPKNAETLYYLGYVLKQQSKLPEARKYLEASLALSPDYAPALASLGTVYGLMKRIPDAIRCYENALRLAPFLPEANVNLASCYNSVGRERDTIRVGRQFLRYYPNDPNMPRLIEQAEDQLKRKKAPTP
ncbi:MAG: tetratricopeptide repeat protein [Akkermansiaceae bacterium]|nr:tetratricopeptide repeat protein [Armatimonadota bacterium]